MLVESETVRDARDLELELRRPLVVLNAPAPMTVRKEAAGHTEWFRGASSQLERAIRMLEKRGHTVHAPLRIWLRSALLTRSDRLYAWSQMQLSPDELDGSIGPTAAQRVVRDTLDAHVILKVELEPLLAPEVIRWYRGRTLPNFDETAHSIG